MSEQVCKNCGRAKYEHLVAWGHRYCTTDTFEPEPEPMKAKPGVFYTHRDLCTPLTRFMIGTTKGDLVRIAAERVAMSSDWLEVPE